MKRILLLSIVMFIFVIGVSCASASVVADDFQKPSYDISASSNPGFGPTPGYGPTLNPGIDLGGGGNFPPGMGGNNDLA